MQIAIDGPAGAGKSTAAKALARALGITYLDTGAMYRAVTWAVIKNGISFQDKAAITALAKTCRIDFAGGRVFLNGEDVSEAIRLPRVSRHTSDVAPLADVRTEMVRRQREIAREQSVVMDGRDIGSVVLPKADFKFYIDASSKIRAERRHAELAEKGIDESVEKIEQDIVRRDYNDSHRKNGPLTRTPDAVYILTDSKDVDTVVREMQDRIQGGR